MKQKKCNTPTFYNMKDKSLIFPHLGAGCAHGADAARRRRVCMKDSEHKACCVLNGKEFLLCVTAQQQRL
jgi:hypothetical protein